MNVVTLLLAAGAANRFGSDKRQAQLASGDTLLQASLACYQNGPGSCIVVLDKNDGPERDWLATKGATSISVASRTAPHGMGDSLAAGAREAARQGYDACLVALADMPWVAATTLSAIAGALLEHPIVVPAWQGQWGHPVGFTVRYFDELAVLTGDRGARSLLKRHAAQRKVLEVADRGVLLDVDCPADLQRAPD